MKTVWLNAAPAVDPQNPRIAGENGIPAGDGLTTRYVYDDDLDDGVGLDSTYSSHLTGLGIGAGSDGSAILVTNPKGERTLSISDGLGRTVRVVQLDAAGAALTKVTIGRDAFVAVAGFGDVIEESSTDGLGNITRTRSDAEDRLIQSVDAAGNITNATYDAGGNRLSVRDANSTGHDCSFDQRGRQTSCTDTQGDVSSKAYDKSSNVTSMTDAKSHVTACVYDSRDRRTSSTDRLAGTTSLAYDKNGNVVTYTCLLYTSDAADE